MTKLTYELSLELLNSRLETLAIVKSVLRNAGLNDQHIVELKEFDKNFLLLYFNQKALAQLFLLKLRRLKLKQVILRLKSIKQSEWENKWRNEFKPFSLTPTFKVIPMEFKNKHRTRQKPLYLGTGLAFGTGLHATTRFMAEFIESVQGRYENFLDIGTGTGILSMIGFQCGAKDVDAIDVRRDAVAAAKQNFKENNCRIRFLRAINLSKFHPPGRYDFVAANLFTQDLIDFSSKLFSLVREGKYLAVSGISLHNYARFKAVYRKFALRCLKVEKKEGWVGILYQKEAHR